MAVEPLHQRSWVAVDLTDDTVDSVLAAVGACVREWTGDRGAGGATPVGPAVQVTIVSRAVAGGVPPDGTACTAPPIVHRAGRGAIRLPPERPGFRTSDGPVSNIREAVVTAAPRYFLIETCPGRPSRGRRG
jgi:hypothetical protein